MDLQSPERDQEFVRLFDRFYQPVARFFAKRGLGNEEIKDLTQETFVSVYRGIGGYRREASEETWLFKIATNTWHNALRTRSAVKRAGEETSLDGLLDAGWSPKDTSLAMSHDPFYEAIDNERSRVIRDAIDTLPPQMRRCIFLRVVQDMKYREIATVMQLSIQTVKSQLFLARAKLKDQLGGYFEDFK